MEILLFLKSASSSSADILLNRKTLLRITTRVKSRIEWFEKRFKLTSRRNQQRKGSVWLKLNYSSRASFSFSLMAKQNKIHKTPATDESQSSLHLLFAVG